VSNSAFKSVYIVSGGGHLVMKLPTGARGLLEIAQQHEVPIIGLVYMDQREKASNGEHGQTRTRRWFRHR